MITHWLVYISYAMGTRDLPDIYTLSPWALGVYIRQTTRAHGITITYTPGITDPTQLILSRIFHARGGAVLIAVTIATSANCTVSNNLFVGNFAQRSTGALYLFTQYTGLHHFYCAKNVFIRNSSPDAVAVDVASLEFFSYRNATPIRFENW